MKYTYRQTKNLFMQQSYLDSWEDYERSLNKSNFIRWDYIILTASNEAQAEVYQSQIEYRLQNRRLPADTHYAVLPDPEGKRVGSGGATFNVMRYIAQQEGTDVGNPFKGKRILVIHSGGIPSEFLSIPYAESCFLQYQESFLMGAVLHCLMNL